MYAGTVMGSTADANEIINFTRGFDVFDEDKDGSTVDERWKLADIYHSNPILVNKPSAGTDTSNKNSDEYSTEVKQFPNKLKSKTTWEIYLDSIKDDNKLIFSVTCDYSFNNRRMDIILSDNSYMINENKKYDFLLEDKGQTTQVKEIDSSGI